MIQLPAREGEQGNGTFDVIGNPRAFKRVTQTTPLCQFRIRRRFWNLSRADTVDGDTVFTQLNSEGPALGSLFHPSLPDRADPNG